MATNSQNLSSVSGTLSQTEQDIQAQLIAQVQTFASHTVRVSYMFLGVIVLILALVGVGGYFGLRSYEAQVARAEALEQKYVDAQKEFAVTLAAHDAQRAADARESAALVAQIAARAKQAPAPVVQAALAPSATALEVRNGLQAVLSQRGRLPDLIGVEGENLVLTAPTAQGVVSDEVELVRDRADLVDTNHLLTLANSDKSSLSSDLTQCKANTAEAQKVIASYKAVAVKSRWRKFLDGALKVGLVAGGIVVGRAL